MKNKYFGIIFASLLVLLLAGIAQANSLQGKQWNVSFTTDNETRLVSDFDDFQQGFADEVRQLQPGDDITFTVNLDNSNPHTADWYMSNKVISSLEDSKAAARGGGYSYLLTYTGPSTELTLYDSQTVGGDTNEGKEGLKEATNALDDFLYLDTLSQGQKGQVKLVVALDGETQGNDYMNTLANLKMNFAVELNNVTPENPTTGNPENPTTTPGTNTSTGGGSSRTPGTVVKTGDNSRLMTLYIIMAVSGVLFLILAIDSVRRRRKEKKENLK